MEYMYKLYFIDIYEISMHCIQKKNITLASEMGAETQILTCKKCSFKKWTKCGEPKFENM